MSLPVRPGREPGGASVRHLRHISSQVTSYTVAPVKVKQPPRVRYPNLSPTRCPSVAADVALWPAWTGLSVEDIDLDQLAEGGTPLFDRKGC